MWDKAWTLITLLLNLAVLYVCVQVVPQAFDEGGWLGALLGVVFTLIGLVAVFRVAMYGYVLITRPQVDDD